MKKIFILFLIFGLVGCSSDRNDPNDPWETTSEELFREHYPLYVQKALEIIDASGKVYTFENLSDMFETLNYWYKFNFENGVSLYLMLSYDQHSRGRISETLRIPFDEDIGTFEVDTSYFMMIEEINRFSVYNHFGDENTFSDLFVRAKERLSNDERAYAEYYVGDHSLGNSYEVYISDTAHTIEFSFSARLSSRNIIN